jgi:hypothetical protein
MGVSVLKAHPVARSQRWRGAQPGHLCFASVNRSYVSRRSLRVSLAEDQLHPSRAFLADTNRVVFLAFPDASRRQRVGPDAWQVHLLPFQVLWWTVGAQCTLRTWSEPHSGALRLTGRELRISGLPQELGSIAQSVTLRVDGILAATPGVSASGLSTIDGQVDLCIAACVPPAIALVPGVDAAVQLVLDRILQRIQGSLKTSLPGAYTAWTREQRAAAAAAAGEAQQQPAGVQTSLSDQEQV